MFDKRMAKNFERMKGREGTDAHPLVLVPVPDPLCPGIHEPLPTARNCSSKKKNQCSLLVQGKKYRTLLARRCK